MTERQGPVVLDTGAAPLSRAQALALASMVLRGPTGGRETPSDMLAAWGAFASACVEYARELREGEAQEEGVSL